ncbi:MAG: phasin family protein [Hyphomicrobiaceae bacterium]|nr:phasin family protein [Hyphomicrobiaceae bacterium]
MSESKRGQSPGPGAEMPVPAVWTMLGNCVGFVEPLARNAARVNLEVSSLAGQRAMAYVAIPQTLTSCRTPMDVVQAQMAFWQEAGRQYATAGQRIMDAWRQALPANLAKGFPVPGELRDYITFPEPKSDEAAEDRRRPGDTRRAA